MWDVTGGPEQEQKNIAAEQAAQVERDQEARVILMGLYAEKILAQRAGAQLNDEWMATARRIISKLNPQVVEEIVAGHGGVTVA